MNGINYKYLIVIGIFVLVVLVMAKPIQIDGPGLQINLQANKSN